MTGADAALAAAREAVARAAERLAAARARDEVLAAFTPATRRFGLPRAARMRVEGRVWRVGALLVDRDGGLHVAGEALRIVDPGTRSTPTALAESRRELRLAARAARIADGETVDLGAVRIPLDGPELVDPTGVLAIEAGVVAVRWSVAATTRVPLDRYLDERVELLVDPPQGA